MTHRAVVLPGTVLVLYAYLMEEGGHMDTLIDELDPDIVRSRLKKNGNIRRAAKAVKLADRIKEGYDVSLPAAEVAELLAVTVSYVHRLYREWDAEKAENGS